MRFVLAILGVVLAGVLASAVAVEVRKARELGRVEAEAREHRDIVVQSVNEKEALRLTMAAVSKEMSELPDSLKAGRTGVAYRRAKEIAKQQQVVESKEYRSRKLLKELESNRKRLESEVRVWRMSLGGAAAAMVAFMLVVKRFSSK